MYVAKFYRESLLWRVVLFEKEWSDIMMTHEVKEISTKRFVLHGRGYRWIYKEIGKTLFTQRKLEVIDG
jgi:hypothetical protein